MMTDKLKKKTTKTFEFNKVEQLLINNRIELINEKNEYYSNRIIYKEILGMKAGIVFITYEFRNELAEYFRQNKFDDCSRSWSSSI